MKNYSLMNQKQKLKLLFYSQDKIQDDVKDYLESLGFDVMMVKDVDSLAWIKFEDYDTFLFSHKVSPELFDTTNYENFSVFYTSKYLDRLTKYIYKSNKPGFMLHHKIIGNGDITSLRVSKLSDQYGGKKPNGLHIYSYVRGGLVDFYNFISGHLRIDDSIGISEETDNIIILHTPDIVDEILLILKYE